MKINGKITMLIDRDQTTIEIRDDNAIITFCKIVLTPDQLSSALSRLADTDCEVEVRSLDLVGKKHEHKTFITKVPEKMNKDDLATYVQSKVDKEEPDWVSDNYFGSRDSFFTKDGVKYCRVTIRRWI